MINAIIDFIKKLLSGEMSPQEAMEKLVPEDGMKKPERQEKKKENPDTQFFKTYQVEKNDKLYRLEGNKLEVSNNEGRKWTLLMALPVYCNDIKVSDNNELIVLGSRTYNGVKEGIKDIKDAINNTIVPKSIKDEDDLWEVHDRWYKIGENGRISVAKNRNTPEFFEPLAFSESKMMIGGKNCIVRVYKMNPRLVFYSGDRVQWDEVNESLPNDFKEFQCENNTTFVIDNKSNKYLYDDKGKCWARIGLEGDLEVFEHDLGYGDIKEYYWVYDMINTKSKMIHLYFVNEGLGFGSVLYNDKNGKLHYFEGIPGLIFTEKMPRTLYSCGGELVAITPNDKCYIFLNDGWKRTRDIRDDGWLKITDSFNDDWKKRVGPFCFKTKIYPGDEYWPIEENGSKLEVYYKIIKDNLSIVYYSFNGKQWFWHSILPADFQTVIHGYERKGAVIYTKKKKFYQWRNHKWKEVKWNEIAWKE